MFGVNKIPKLDRTVVKRINKNHLMYDRLEDMSRLRAGSLGIFSRKRTLILDCIQWPSSIKAHSFDGSVPFAFGGRMEERSLNLSISSPRSPRSLNSIVCLLYGRRSPALGFTQYRFEAVVFTLEIKTEKLGNNYLRKVRKQSS